MDKNDGAASLVRSDALLADLIAVARTEFGEPEYKYFRVEHAWTCPRRNKPRRAGYHSVCVSHPDPECTREEYEANVKRGTHDRVEAFMGRLPRTFHTWERRLVKDGWPQALSKRIADTANDRLTDGGPKAL